MSLGLNLHSCGSEARWFRAASLAVRGLAYGVGLVLTLGLVGCGGRGQPQVQYVRVEVPVQVPCRAPEVAVPAWATADLRKSDNLELKVRALLAERLQRIGYEKQMQAALAACQ